MWHAGFGELGLGSSGRFKHLWVLGLGAVSRFACAPNSAKPPLRVHTPTPRVEVERTQESIVTKQMIFMLDSTCSMSCFESDGPT